MMIDRLLPLALSLAALVSSGCGGSSGDEARGDGGPDYNVLFLAVDDWRPWAGCYGTEGARTPAIDRLAESATVFQRAYCQIAACGPSRATLLTGRRPEATGVWANHTSFREALPDVVTIPQLFLEAGYRSLCVGKILHAPQKGGDPRSWSEPTWIPDRWQTYRVEEPESVRSTPEWKGVDAQAPDVADDELPDGMMARRAVELLEQMGDERFFLGVGFVKPHLPLVAPKRYWDLYDEADFADVPRWPAPEGMNEHTLMRDDADLEDEQALVMLHGYAACVSYIDAQIGLILDALDRLDLARDTIVVLWGDHGLHMGENGTWGKGTLLDLALRSPLLIRVPGVTDEGADCAGLVEFVDVYPTLAELCGLEAPADLEGSSLVPLLREPDRAWKPAVFSEVQRSDARGGGARGVSMRTDRYRLTIWTDRRLGSTTTELYDYEVDPRELRNLADDAAYRDVLAELRPRLRAGWSAARPPS